VGILLSGEKTLPARLHLGEDPTWVELTLLEGRFHQVKRMFQARGNQVLYLKRLALGPLTLEDLPLGAARPLTPEEERALYQAPAPLRLRGRRLAGRGEEGPPL
jgi:16S rRNA pseudouridine516 synthase